MVSRWRAKRASDTPCRTQTSQGDQKHRPNPEYNGAPTKPFADEDKDDLTDPGEDVQPGVDARLRGWIGDANLLKDDRVCARVS